MKVKLFENLMIVCCHLTFLGVIHPTISWKRISRLSLEYKIISIYNPKFLKINRILLIIKKADSILTASFNIGIAKTKIFKISTKQIFRASMFHKKLIVNLQK
jgi:hypothetical protein